MTPGWRASERCYPSQLRRQCASLRVHRRTTRFAPGAIGVRVSLCGAQKRGSTRAIVEALQQPDAPDTEASWLPSRKRKLDRVQRR
jgi:hypothetical protein